jgi:hypothetical protein
MIDVLQCILLGHHSTAYHHSSFTNTSTMHHANLLSINQVPTMAGKSRNHVQSFSERKKSDSFCYLYQNVTNNTFLQTCHWNAGCQIAVLDWVAMSWIRYLLFANENSNEQNNERTNSMYSSEPAGRSFLSVCPPHPITHPSSAVLSRASNGNESLRAYNSIASHLPSRFSFPFLTTVTN